MFMPVGKVFTRSFCATLQLLGMLSHNLRIALIQVKRAVHFLLLHKKFPQAFFMLEGAFLLLPVISERFFLTFTFGCFFFGKAWKTADGMVNTGYRAQCALCIQ